MRILIAYDGSAHADAAIDDLRRAGLPRDCEAIVVSVGNENPWNETMKEVAVLAEKGQGRVQSDFPEWTVSSEPLWGDPAKMLLKTIDVWKPDLIVVGSHGRSAATKLLLGSVSDRLVHHASCSVRVVRFPSKAGGPIRILIATDGSLHSERCVEAVARRSWPEGTEVRVFAVMQTLVPAVTTVPQIEAETFATERAYRVIAAADDQVRAQLRWAVDEAAQRLRAAGLVAEPVLIDGDARTEILKEAARWHADCVFVGARGLGALDRLVLGSVSGTIVKHAPCAVEVVRRATEG